MRTLLIVFSLVFPLLACAEGNSESSSYKEGQHYKVLDAAVRTSDPSKIEVTEVFWYGCGHCFKFESIIEPWKDKLPSDVEFEASPAMWPVRRPGVPANWMEVHARAFYIAKALGVLDKMHKPLFDALNVDKKLLKNAEEVAELFSANGVEKEKVLKMFDSFGITSQVKQADSRAKGYRISGTPEMVVDGKYKVSARMAGSQAEMLKVVDYLIKKIRSERS